MSDDVRGVRRASGVIAAQILDTAERHFAVRGYAATSVSEIAAEVGVRAPAVYKHFDGKEDLYEAVIDRLLAPIQDLVRQAETAMQPEDMVGPLLRQNVANPNLARLLMHASLAGGMQMRALVQRRWRPVVREALGLVGRGESDDAASKAALMAFNNLMLGYVAMTPLHAAVLDTDPTSPELLDAQVALLERFAAKADIGASP
ncbi:TetR/AcrR family transcriptional regulator [Mycobacterium spongiae]|uniref:TetR family transcriptional regulator n=1 Tax=Mycobacterium spongiae TaxID=886343 RepID=A0A975JX71_9MYCO|nr:TetR/AcrR family transcriptional regulator [Mycobacterium spongiae]QUR67356.1 TetR family transcriptional regulator [Mycobacterium spongiae]